VQATDRTHLRELLNNRTSGGIIFTTIQKFEPFTNELKEDAETYTPLDKVAETSASYGKSTILTDRKNVIVMADEAHRSQYGFGADIVKGGNEADIKYGYAKYMRDSLPNASYIGFTGTPVELTDKNTRAVFGDYIDIYDMTRAVEDGTTVKIFYESRIAKLELPEELNQKSTRNMTRSPSIRNTAKRKSSRANGPDLKQLSARMNGLSRSPRILSSILKNGNRPKRTRAAKP
jgi:type I restriction enzyme, R subunit